MDTFPVLSSGAVAQYPSMREIIRRWKSYKYVDGSEQRLRDTGAVLRRWTIRLSNVSHQEAKLINDFFSQQRGRAGTFRFVDPWTGNAYIACLDEDSVKSTYSAEDASRLELSIREVKV